MTTTSAVSSSANVSSPTMFAGLGVNVFRFNVIAQGFRAEAVGMRLTRKAPTMSKVVLRDYALKIKRTPVAKQEAADMFRALAGRLHNAIALNEVDNLTRLEAVKDDGPAFIRLLADMME